MLRRSTRSRSRGRVASQTEAEKPATSPTGRKKKPDVEKPIPPEKLMAFEVGDVVLARWPGSKLYYNAKVQFVREDDNEYDVEYENGIVFTLAAKDVMRQSAGLPRKALHSRKSKSKSRARSVGRGKQSSKTVNKEILSTSDSIESSNDLSNASVTEEVVEREILSFSKSASNSSKKSTKSSKSSLKAKNSSLSDESIDADLQPKSPNKTSSRSIKSQKSTKSSRSSLITTTGNNTENVTDGNLTEDLTDDEALPVSPRKVSNRSNKSLKLASSPRVSNKSIVAEEIISSYDNPLKLSNSSKVSNKMSRSSKVSIPGEQITFEEVEIKQYSYSSRTSKAMSRSSRISKVSSSIPKVVAAAAVTDGFSDDDDNMLSVSARGSRSSVLKGPPETQIEEMDINQVVPEKRSSVSSLRQSISSKISSILFGNNDEQDVAVIKGSNSSKVSMPPVINSQELVMENIEENDSNGTDITDDQPSGEITNVTRSSNNSQNVTDTQEPLEEESDEEEELVSPRRSSRLSARTSNTKYDGEEEVVSPRRSSRISLRISNTSKIADKPSTSSKSLRLDEFSEDELEETNVRSGVEDEEPLGIDLGAKKKSWSFEWIWAIFFMILCPVILTTLHNICTGNVTHLSGPLLSFNPLEYIDKEAIMMILGFVFVLRMLEFLCLGKEVQGYRMNGFQALILILASVPALIYHDIPISPVSHKYFYLMISCIVLSYGYAIFAYLLSLLRPPSPDGTCAKGNTGNFIVDIFHGRAVNPVFLGCNLKLQTFRFSMIGLALINVCLVTDSLLSSDSGFSNPNPALIIGSSLQILYAMDAMWFEEYYFYSLDSLNSGYGWSLISSYITFPFLPTLITRYLLARQPTLGPIPLAGICVLNMIGYIIYRSTESQRCEMARDPQSASLSHLKTMETSQGRKLIVSGWWGLVRHPNYLGELLIQWSWVLPAVNSLEASELVPYYLPVVTTLMLVIRSIQINNKNKRKFGAAWEEYSGKVKSNIVPLIF